MRKIFIFSSCSVLSLLITFGCAPKTNIHSQEATAFCEVFNPENWRDFQQNTSYEDFQIELTNRIAKVVVTPEFRNIFKELSETPYSPDLNVYNFYKVRIGKLIGHDWNCPNAEKFYSVEWKRVDSTTSESDTSQANSIAHENAEIVMSISNNGDLIVNSKKLKDSSIGTLKDALSLSSSSEPPSILILKEHNVDDKKLISLMDSLSKLGITKLRMGEVETADR